MKQELICIVCPLSCHITVTMDEDKTITDVKGHTCPRGEKYARSECTHPTRMLTSTVVIDGGRYERLPVITSAPIPKESMMHVMEALKGVRVTAPVQVKDIIIANVCDLGVNIVASRTMEKCR